MARRPAQFNYDQLYWYFAREEHRLEWSTLEWDSEDPLTNYWTTSVETECGIDLRRPPLFRERTYCQAPLNSVKFARTGGDGIHYSFLVLDGHWSELSPVILTYPWRDPDCRNFVVANDLTEFLRLGIRRGYFALWAAVPNERGVAHDPAYLRELESGEFPEDIEPGERKALKRLARRFRLDPLDGVAERLAELRRRYQPLLQIPPDRREIDILEATRRALRPGDAVLWIRRFGERGYPLVRAKILAVSARHVTIAAQFPDDPEGHVVIRKVGLGRLRKQQPVLPSDFLPPLIARKAQAPVTPPAGRRGRR